MNRPKSFVPIDRFVDDGHDTTQVGLFMGTFGLRSARIIGSFTF